jgi:hypothetical protein
MEPCYTSFTLHQRQFIIATHEILHAKGWQSLKLSDEFILSFQSALRIESVPNRDRKILLLGERYAIAELPSHEKLTELCSGRFAIIEWPYIYGDATNLLSIFYSAASGEPIISSSPALLAVYGSFGQSERKLHWGGINWFPGPGSRVNLGRKLLRDQRLHIPSLQVEHFPRTIEPCDSFEAARESLATSLVALAQQISGRSQTVYLALTAGRDSRTLAAAFLAAGLRFETFTQRFDGVAENDIKIAAQISRSFGIRHHVIDLEPRDDQALQIWRQHTLSSYCDADDNRLFLGNSYRFLRRGDVFVVGGVFEFGRHFFAEVIRDLTYENAQGRELWARFESDAEADPHTVACLDEWLSWRRKHPNGLDLTDGFYLDQRIGGWLASIEQALDTLPGISINPANCGRILSALITPTTADRLSGRLQQEAVATLEPKLLRFPINPPRARTLSDYGRAVVRRVKRALVTFAKR